MKLDFCDKILKEHCNNCISLASIVQIMIIASFKMALIYGGILSLIKSKNAGVGLLKKYYGGDMKYVGFTVDTIYTALLFSFSLIVYKLFDGYSKKFSESKIPYTVKFLIIFNIMIIILDFIIGIAISTYSSNSPVAGIFKKWHSTIGTIPVLLHDMVYFNLVALIGFTLIKKGWSNIVITPLYAIMFFKYI